MCPVMAISSKPAQTANMSGMGVAMPTAFVTGANRGIGLAVARDLAKDHAVILAMRDPAKAPAIPGARVEKVDVSDPGFHRRECHRLFAELEGAHTASSLPEVPTGRDALDELLVRMRLRTIE